MPAANETSPTRSAEVIAPTSSPVSALGVTAGPAPVAVEPAADWVLTDWPTYDW